MLRPFPPPPLLLFIPFYPDSCWPVCLKGINPGRWISHCFLDISGIYPEGLYVWTQPFLPQPPVLPGMTHGEREARACVILLWLTPNHRKRPSSAKHLHSIPLLSVCLLPSRRLILIRLHSWKALPECAALQPQTALRLLCVCRCEATHDGENTARAINRGDKKKYNKFNRAVD